MARATWFCIDIECSGPVPGLYDMLSLGAVVVAHGPDGPQALPETFYVEIRPTAPHVDAGAMKVNRLDLERLKVEGLSMRAAFGMVSVSVGRELTTDVLRDAVFDSMQTAYAAYTDRGELRGAGGQESGVRRQGTGTTQLLFLSGT